MTDNNGELSLGDLEDLDYRQNPTGDPREEERVKCQCGVAELLSGTSATELMGVRHSVMDPCGPVDMTEPAWVSFDPETSNLVQHAKRELEIGGVPPEDAQMLVSMVEKFASYGHSGGSASWFIHVLVRLLQFENLTDLTNRPSEWNLVGGSEEAGDATWQSKRNPEAFSKDGGRTYYLLSENANPARPDKFRTSTNYLRPGH